jgi:eukaryotic-like serine/threonine-protein kinase
VDSSRLLAKRYRLVEYLGGTNAEVYRGYDRQLRRPVAVKIARAGSDFEAARFENEMRVLASLRHPSLVTLYDAGVADKRPYLVMQYVPGMTLGSRLRSTRLAPVEARRIGRALASALEYLHGVGVIHRDIKPDNVLLSADGEVFLADLGIARAGDAAALTAAGMVIGTPAYLAPEQVAADAVGAPCDVYALGLVLLECLTGRREYRGGNAVEVALMRLTRPPGVPADLPAPWPALLAGMTATDPAARPTAAEVADSLGVIPPRRLVPAWTPHRQAAAALAAGAAALALLTGLTDWSAAPDQPALALTHPNLASSSAMRPAPKTTTTTPNATTPTTQKPADGNRTPTTQPRPHRTAPAPAAPPAKPKAPKKPKQTKSPKQAKAAGGVVRAP